MERASGSGEGVAVGEQLAEITVQDALEVLWQAHLVFTRSAASYTPNRKALCRSFGGKYFHELTSYDFRVHRKNRLEGLYPFHKRKAASLGTVYHDHGLIHLLYSKFTEWKREGVRPRDLDLSALKLPTYPPTAGVRKVKPPKRNVEYTPEEFHKLWQASTNRLRRTIEGLADLDIRMGDLFALKPENYNPYDDHIHWTQKKTGKEHSLPATRIVRQHFIEARKNGWDYVYDDTNRIAEFKEARHTAKIRKFLTMRDIRKSVYNIIKRKTKDASVAGVVAGHASTRTGLDFYDIPTKEGLRPVMNYVSRILSSGARRKIWRKKYVDRAA